MQVPCLHPDKILFWCRCLLGVQLSHRYFCQGWLWGSEFVFKDETLMLLTRLSFHSRTHLRSFLSQKAACSRAWRDCRFLWQRFHFKDCWDIAQRGVQSPLCGAQAVKLFVWEVLIKHSGPGLQRTPGVLLARQRSRHPSCSDGSGFVRHLSLAQGGCPRPEEAPRGVWNSTQFKFTFPDKLIKK